MEFALSIVEQAVRQVLLSLLHNWPYLAASIAIAAMLQVFVNAGRVSAFLGRHRKAGVVAATAAAVATPLCSCGTTAVVLGMMASTMPWAPIVAFMVASPLSSPEGMVYSAGLFGWPFAVASFVFSILLGLAGGGIAAFLEGRGWLTNQARFVAPVTSYACCQQDPLPAAALFAGTRTLQLVGGCDCDVAVAPTHVYAPSGGAGSAATVARKPNARISGLPREMYIIGKRLIPMFLGFAFIGYLLNGLVPAAWISALFGSGNFYSVPLAATLGLPLYVNSEASLPMIRALLDSGMNQGAVMAFLIAGSGTSMGAIAGALTIARWRVVGVVVGVLWIGAMLSGFAYDLLLSLRLF